jgi:hypothetical protein
MSATGGPKIAINAVIYLNTATFASPTWVAVSLVGDVTVTPAWDMGEANTRGNRLKQKVKTMLDITVSAKVRADDADTSYDTLWEAAHNDTVLNMLVLDGPLTKQGARGYWMDFQVAKSSQDQSLGSVIFTEFEFTPTPSVNAQNRVVVGTGSTVLIPVFSTDLAIGS